MNYIRKIVAITLAVLFCAALVVSICFMFAIRNVNVEFLSYSNAYIDDYEQCKANYEKIKGTNLFLLSDEDIGEGVQSNHIVLQSYEKVFPCTVNIVIKERVETFAVAGAGGFDIYDEEGVLVAQSDKNANSIDGSPNVLLDVNTEKLDISMAVCRYFKNSFSALRSAVERVEIWEDPIGKIDSTLTLKLYSGLSIILMDYEVYPEQKMAAVYKEFLTLNERQKLRGTIYASAPNGELSAVDAVYLG